MSGSAEETEALAARLAERLTWAMSSPSRASSGRGRRPSCAAPAARSGSSSPSRAPRSRSGTGIEGGSTCRTSISSASPGCLRRSGAISSRTSTMRSLLSSGRRQGGDIAAPRLAHEHVGSSVARHRREGAARLDVNVPLRPRSGRLQGRAATKDHRSDADPGVRHGDGGRRRARSSPTASCWASASRGQAPCSRTWTPCSGRPAPARPTSTRSPSAPGRAVSPARGSGSRSHAGWPSLSTCRRPGSRRSTPSPPGTPAPSR